MINVNTEISHNKNILFNINGTNTSLTVSEIPTISPATKAIFKKLGTDSSAYLSYPLKDKAETIIHAIQKMQETKEHETRDKIFAVLRSALTVAIAVAGVLAGVFAFTTNPGSAALVALGVMYAAIIAYTILAYYNAHRAGCDDLVSAKGGPASVFFAWIGGPFFPICEAFGKVAWLESSIARKKKEAKANFAKIVSFFKRDHSGLQRLLKEEIEKCEQSLKMLSGLPVTSPTGKGEIEDRKKNCERALEEFEKAVAYYSQVPILSDKF